MINSNLLKSKFEKFITIKTLTINKIPIVFENRDLSEWLLLKIFWSSIRPLRHVDSDKFIRDVLLFQNGCNALRASRDRYLDSDTYVKYATGSASPGSAM